MSSTNSRRRFLGLIGGSTAAGAFAPSRSVLHAFAAVTPASGTPVSGPASTLLLRVDQIGGFVPPTVLVTRLPLVAIYQDGTVITTGPMIEIYPSPALPNLRELTLTPAGIAHVVDLARSAGLEEDRRYEGAAVTDMPDTVFAFADNGRSTTVSAYALAFDEDSIADPALRAARKKLIDLLTQLTDLTNTLSPDEIAAPDHAYAIERIRVLAQPIDPANPPAGDLAQQPMDWPLPIDLATFGATGATPFELGNIRCGVLNGEEAKTLVAALAKANQLTPWVSHGVQYQLWIRPLLPDEPSACA